MTLAIERLKEVTDVSSALTAAGINVRESE